MNISTATKTRCRGSTGNFPTLLLCLKCVLDENCKNVVFLELKTVSFFFKNPKFWSGTASFRNYEIIPCNTNSISNFIIFLISFFFQRKRTLSSEKGFLKNFYHLRHTLEHICRNFELKKFQGWKLFMSPESCIC